MNQLSIFIILHLLSLLLSFSSISIVSGGRSTMRFHWTFILRILERKESSSIEKDEAFEALVSIFEEFYEKDCCDYFEDEELFERTITVCFKEVKLRVTSNDESHVANTRIARLLLKCLQSNRSLCTEKKMLDDDLIFPWMFKRILSDEDDEHKIFVKLLSYFMSYLDEEDRVMIIIRYFPGLQEASRNILKRNAVNIATISSFFRSEMAGIAAGMPAEFARWVEKTTEEKTMVCYIVINVMEISIDSTSTLHQLFGCDLLSISSYLSSLPPPGPYRSLRDDFFRRILDRYPQFRQQFRKWTVQGPVGNPIADLGRTILPKDLTRQGTNYIFYEEDNEE